MRTATSLSLALLALACTAEPGVDTEGSEAESGALEDLPHETTGETAGETTAETTGDLPGDPDPGDCTHLEQLVDELGAEPDPDVGQAMIAAFVDEAVWGEHGFPLVEDQRLCVVYLGDDAATTSVTGDFDGWDPLAHPLSVAAPGFAYAIVELDAAPAGLYKLVHDGGEFVADPLARRFGWDAFGEYSQVDALADRSHHERWPGFAEGVGELAPRTVTVWLPPGAADETELPVLYMHDGQNLFAPDALFGGWQVGPTLDEAIAGGTLAPMVVVGIDNSAARMDEYTQIGDVIDGMPVGGRADEYADFLVGGVKPFVESRYPVASDRASVAVMGSSLGGLVSLHIGRRHPDLFGSVASMSGTIAWGSIGANNPTIVDAYLADPPTGLRIYLDSGGSEGLGCPGDGSDNYCGNVELADTLRGLGWVDEDDLFYRWEPGAPHNEAAWAARLLPALVDWFSG